jgi:hypothetical protein
VLEQGRETGLEHGSGLGLWLVVWATRKMGGTVSFGQAPQGGCEVTVRVPAEDPPETAEESAAHSGELSSLDERVRNRLSPDETADSSGVTEPVAEREGAEQTADSDDHAPLGQEPET